MRRWNIALLVLSFALAGAVACAGVDTTKAAAQATPTPSGDDDDDDGSTPNPTAPPATPTPPPAGSGAESEPNDLLEEANDLGGSGSKTFSGTVSCPEAGPFDDDTFKVAAGAGALTATLTWTDANDDDLDLFVFTEDFAVDEIDEAIPPADSPASITATVPADTIYIGVFCYLAVGDVTYTGTINVP